MRTPFSAAPSSSALAAAALAAALAGSLPATAQTTQRQVAPGQAAPAQQGTRVGVLQCDVSAGIGLIITSSRELNCRFTDRQGRSERYVGAIRRYGLDVGASSRGVMSWAVFAPARVTRGALQGEYVGATAGASVGVGGAVNVLVGGSQDSISLQPVSVEANRGLNFALGVGDLTLVAAAEPARARRASAER